jgi:hypothetical protein
MKLALVVLAVGCTKAAPPTEAPKPPDPPAITAVDAGVPMDAAPTAPSIAVLQQQWPEQTTGEIRGVPLAGPFVSLAGTCAALGKTVDDCHFAGDGDVTDAAIENKAFLDFDWINIDHAVPEGGDHTLNVRRHYAYRTKAGWFVTGRIEGVGGGRGGMSVDHQEVDGHLVTRFVHTKASSGKWAGTYTYGIAICRTTAPDGVECTPRIVTGRVDYATKRRDEPGGIETPSLACTPSFAAGTLTIGPVPNTKIDDRKPYDPTYSRVAADACAALPYGGRRPIVFSR